ncbi:hypothetical protein RJ55_02851 [Drechmeria coniospora]|nr:hypothetical protein RJ55_02851 [Drechmeria coniospora]
MYRATGAEPAADGRTALCVRAGAWADAMAGVGSPYAAPRRQAPQHTSKAHARTIRRSGSSGGTLGSLAWSRRVAGKDINMRRRVRIRHGIPRKPFSSLPIPPWYHLSPCTAFPFTMKPTDAFLLAALASAGTVHRTYKQVQSRDYRDDSVPAAPRQKVEPPRTQVLRAVRVPRCAVPVRARTVSTRGGPAGGD